ncbi:MAG: RDD family protein [Clostridiales bacterium]|nr:RDD family protein [Clostridiales bacterium]
MREKLSNTDILGILCDDSLNKFKERLGLNMSLSALINAIFLVFMGGYVILTIFVIHPALPNFTGNQVTTDNIIFGVIAMLFILFVAFFLKLNSAASVVVCHGPRDADIPPGLAIKILFRRAFGVFSVTVAKFLIITAIFGIFGLFWLLNLDNWAIWGIIFVALVATLIFYRSLTFFATTLSIIEKKYFFGAIFASAKLVFKRGFVRILSITTLISIVNALLFFGIFYALHALISPRELLSEMDLFSLYFILFDPLFYSIILLACIPLIFLAPRLNLIALSFYNPPDIIAPRAGLGSRTLAVIVDFLILIVAFFAVYLLALFALGLNFNLENINIGVAAVLILAYFFLFMLYNIYFEVMNFGQTPGKRLMSLRVTTEDGAPVKLLQSILRNILRILDIVSFIVILIDRKHHRLGDVLSYTKVCFAIEEINDEEVGDDV